MSAQLVEQAFQGLHPDWLPLLEEAGARETVLAAVEDAAAHQATTSPRAALIFEALRWFGPDDARVLVLGQDPYPTGGQGLSFSSETFNKGVKASLRQILANLAKNGHSDPPLLNPENPEGGRIANGDLRTWALQGVLMINAALTTHRGRAKKQVAIWKDFTSRFLGLVSRRAAARGRPLACLLWGGPARQLKKHLAPGSHVLEWCHPSPLANNGKPPGEQFAANTHFADANALIGAPPIDWDPVAPTRIFTDGACKANGAANARASFAVFVQTGPIRGAWVTGVVAPRRYEFIDPTDPLKGFTATLSSPPEGDPPRSAAAKNPAQVPTNNRGEYLAGCWAFLLLLRSATRGPCELVTDSDLFRNTMLEWLPKWRRAGTAAEHKNFDLVVIAETLLAMLNHHLEPLYGESSVRITHVRSHRPAPPPTPLLPWLMWRGNDVADRLAARSQKAGKPPRPDGGVMEAGIQAGHRWRLLGRHGQWPAE